MTDPEIGPFKLTGRISKESWTMNFPPDVFGMFAPQFCNWKCRYPVLYVVLVPSEC